MKKINTIITLLVILIMTVGCNINNTTPDDLIGVIMNYKYSGGNEYTVKIEDKGLSYQFKSGPKPEKWWGPFANNHMVTEGNNHIVAWHEPGYGDYITLVIDFEKHILYGSGIIGKKTIHFQKANIANVTFP